MIENFLIAKICNLIFVRFIILSETSRCNQHLEASNQINNGIVNMAASILTENSILVYGFAQSRSKIPFETINGVHNHPYASAFLFACSGEKLRKDERKPLDDLVNKNQLMRQCRIGLGSFQNLLWALVFGDYF